SESEADKQLARARLEMEDRLSRLEADLAAAMQRAERAEQWLEAIRQEVEGRLLPSFAAARDPRARPGAEGGDDLKGSARQGRRRAIRAHAPMACCRMRPASSYCCGMAAASRTLFQRAYSFAMNLPKASGVEPCTTTPALVSCCRTVSSASSSL